MSLGLEKPKISMLPKSTNQMTLIWLLWVEERDHFSSSCLFAAGCFPAAAKLQLPGCPKSCIICCWTGIALLKHFFALFIQYKISAIVLFPS